MLNFENALDNAKAPWYNDYRRKKAFCQQAGVAQLVEQLICNQQVGGSSPSTSSIIMPGLRGQVMVNASDLWLLLRRSSRAAKGGRL